MWPLLTGIGAALVFCKGAREATKTIFDGVELLAVGLNDSMKTGSAAILVENMKTRNQLNALSNSLADTPSADELLDKLLKR